MNDVRQITIKIKLEADRGAVELTGAYSVKAPPEPRMRGSLLYIANSGFLSARDPRQSAMTIRSIDGQRPEILP